MTFFLLGDYTILPIGVSRYHKNPTIWGLSLWGPCLLIWNVPNREDSKPRGYGSHSPRSHSHRVPKSRGFYQLEICLTSTQKKPGTPLKEPRKSFEGALERTANPCISSKASKIASSISAPSHNKAKISLTQLRLI